MEKDNYKDLKDYIFRYLSFWHYFLISIVVFICMTLIFLRYTNNVYRTVTKIEIVDKAMDSDMSLPTAMTIFNRSMINLENEIEVISSNRIITQVVKELDLYFKYYSVGRVITSENHKSEWLGGVDYSIKLTIDQDSIKNVNRFIISFNKNGMIIDHEVKDEILNSYEFLGFDNLNSSDELPFDLIIESNSLDKIIGNEYVLVLQPVSKSVYELQNQLQVLKIGKQSDLLSISLRGNNYLISEDFLQMLNEKFNLDGVYDRQLVYKRTIDFVDSRYGFLKDELNLIEERKESFKKEKDLVFIDADVEVSTKQRTIYDSELFKVNSELDLSNLLLSYLETNNHDYMPANIGIDDLSINELINQYNNLISEKNKLNFSAGENNVYNKNLNISINNMRNSVKQSIANYINSLNIKADNLKEKENEFISKFDKIPQNERLLREIEREQEIKEALFLLLLQKREEAAINFAVTKPSIKIVDPPITDINPIYPKPSLIFISALFLAILLPSSVIYLKFMFDDKIHTRKNLSDRINNIPVIGEIPHIINKDFLKTFVKHISRDPLAESIRMVVANLNFILFNKESVNKKNNLILVTSSVKGEGKTIISVNTASILSSKYNKILLIGADLRNPQIHKFLGVKKSKMGLSDYIYNSQANWEDYILKEGKMDILLSGTIPPNPTELLSSDRFSSFISEVRKKYDYVVIDSAPCLLVSDTFEISKYVDTTLYVIRSNFSSNNLCDFINECKKENNRFSYQ